MYETLGNLLVVCLAIMTIGAIGIVGAFMLGFFGTWSKATKKIEWEYNYSIRAKKFANNEFNLPVNKQQAIYFPSFTTCYLSVVATLAVFERFVIFRNAQAIYDCWFLLYRSSSNEGALRATHNTAIALMFILSLLMCLAMRFGRCWKIHRLQKKNMKQGYIVPVRSRGTTVYLVCFIGTFTLAMADKVSKKIKRALVAARR